MTVKHFENMARNKHECDQCKTVDFWGDTWSWFGSLLMLDECPTNIPTLCSQTCADKFKERIDAGAVKFPVIISRGFTCSKKSERVGY